MALDFDAVIDTSVLIAATRQGQGIDRLNDLIRQRGFRYPAVCVVTTFEYELGELRAGRKPSFGTMFPTYIVVPLSDSIWKRAAFIQDFSIGANAKMELADLLIARLQFSRKCR
jgi:predicted nucleic acid-binding protein